MFVVDMKDRLLLMHRTDKVRSAKNVWSIPSGTHELGETIFDCASRELLEEYGLEIECMQFVDQYENIAGDEPDQEQYHWVMTLLMVRVADVTKAINREPDKHDKMETLPYTLLANDSFLADYQFHTSLQQRLMLSAPTYVDNIRWFLHGADEITETPTILEESLTAGPTIEVPLSGMARSSFDPDETPIHKFGNHQYDEE